MSVELAFLAVLITKAEARLAHQAAQVAALPSESVSVEAVLACEILQTMSDRVVRLRRHKMEALVGLEPTKAVIRDKGPCK